MIGRARGQIFQPTFPTAQIYWWCAAGTNVVNVISVRSWLNMKVHVNFNSKHVIIVERCFHFVCMMYPFFFFFPHLLICIDLESHIMALFAQNIQLCAVVKKKFYEEARDGIKKMNALRNTCFAIFSSGVMVDTRYAVIFKLIH